MFLEEEYFHIDSKVRCEGAHPLVARGLNPIKIAYNSDGQPP